MNPNYKFNFNFRSTYHLIIEIWAFSFKNIILYYFQEGVLLSVPLKVNSFIKKKNVLKIFSVKELKII